MERGKPRLSKERGLAILFVTHDLEEAIALGDQLFEGVNLVAPEDYPLQQRLARLVGQPVQLAPGLGRDAVLISRRGGDFELTLGADLTIGYEVHDAKQVRLYFTESIAYRTLEHTAGVRLTSTSA